LSPGRDGPGGEASPGCCVNGPTIASVEG
jgi:hypothetical protein